MTENNLSSATDFFRKESVMFKGREFSCFREGGLSSMTILFGKYNCLTYFYELLKTHFDDYFKHYGCLKFQTIQKFHLILYRNQKILSVAAEINILINNAV